MFRKVKTIIFDWDGTLHNSIVIYQKAFLKAYQYLIDNHGFPVKAWHQNEIQKFLGQNPKEMWATFTPKLSTDVIETVSLIVSTSMKESILQGEAVLYPDAMDTLKYLKKKGYHLVYLSNSKIYYMDLMRQTFDLNKYFDTMLCSEMYDFIPKKDILKQEISRFDKDMVMIGDRELDIETGIYNKIYTIGCTYGYGDPYELNQADALIENIKDLKELL